jgi:hypothetical protein
MVGQYGDLRRKRATPASPAREAHARSEAAGPAKGVASREALDVASYISDMTAQLEAMSLAAGLDLLGYFLGMARSEADLFVRTNESPEDETAAEDNEPGGLLDVGQSSFDSSGT